jgi:hypothetical protein
MEVVVKITEFKDEMTPEEIQKAFKREVEILKTRNCIPGLVSYYGFREQ